MKYNMHASLTISVYMKRHISWFWRKLEASNGILMIDACDWKACEGDVVVYTNASLHSLGIHFPQHHMGLFCEIPIEYRSRDIFFYEAFATLCAIHFAIEKFPSAKKIGILTDSLNTHDVYYSLKANERINPILMAAMNLLLVNDKQLMVDHLPGYENGIADALSRDPSKALLYESNLAIEKFTPPTGLLEAWWC